MLVYRDDGKEESGGHLRECRGGREGNHDLDIRGKRLSIGGGWGSSCRSSKRRFRDYTRKKGGRRKRGRGGGTIFQRKKGKGLSRASENRQAKSVAAKKGILVERALTQRRESQERSDRRKKDEHRRSGGDIHPRKPGIHRKRKAPYFERRSLTEMGTIKGVEGGRRMRETELFFGGKLFKEVFILTAF